MKSVFRPLLVLPIFFSPMVPFSTYAEKPNFISLAKEKAMNLEKETCPLLFDEKASDDFPTKVHKFTYTTEQKEKATAHLVQIPCWLGAYNQPDAYVLFYGSEPARLLSFAVPDYKVIYEDKKLNENGGDDEVVKSIEVTGYSTRDLLVLTEFAPKTLEITEFNKSRGIGDAFTVGVWRFSNGRFSLAKFAVDAAFDRKRELQEIVRFEEKQ